MKANERHKHCKKGVTLFARSLPCCEVLFFQLQ